MKYFLAAMAIVLLLGLTLVSGIIHGRMTDRWGVPQTSLDAAEKLGLFSEDKQFGDWKCESSNRMSDHVVEMLACAEHIDRTYVNQRTGETVNVAVLLGPPGPISVHTPEVCYSSRAYDSRDERQRVTIKTTDGTEHTFWALTFRSNRLDADILRVYYAWTAGGPWASPKEPRWSFSNCPYIYKIQLASHLPLGSDVQTDDPCRRFLQDFVPALKSHLIEASGD